MNSIRFLIFLLAFVTLQVTKSQNLISNPGFEKCDLCGRFGNSGVEFSYLNGANTPPDWFGATEGSSDIRETNPHTGKRHGGFYSFGKFEYLGNVLLKPLEPEAEYEFSFWLSTDPKNSYSLDEIGVYFQKGLPRYSVKSNLGALVTPQWTTPDGEFIPINNYKKFSFTYKACGGEDHIIIGRFKDFGKNDTMRTGNGDPNVVYPYTLVDDVELIKIKDGPDLLPSTIALCPGEEIKVSVPNSYSEIIWSNGSKLNTTIITYSDKVVYVQVRNNPNCSFITDSVIVTRRPNTFDSVDLISNKRICLNSLNELDASNFNYQNYLWNTGDTTAKISISTSGTYIVMASKDCHEARDTIIVVDRELVQEDLLPDTLCFYNANKLNAQHSLFNHYHWSTGDTTSVININRPGIYTVEATNECKYTIDSIHVITSDGYNSLFQFPNVITANAMENNKFVLIPGGNLAQKIESYHLNIYNRWGKSVFETRDYKDEWIPSLEYPSDTYTFYLVWKVDGCSSDYKGSFTILK